MDGADGVTEPARRVGGVRTEKSTRGEKQGWPKDASDTLML